MMDAAALLCVAWNNGHLRKNVQIATQFLLIKSAGEINLCGRDDTGDRGHGREDTCDSARLEKGAAIRAIHHEDVGVHTLSQDIAHEREAVLSGSPK